MSGLVGKAGASHVLFSPETVNPQHATFLNVTFGSSFDADDTHVGAMLHPGIAAWSAALAVAEHTGASGPEVLAAVVAGYETIIRIGLAVQPSHFKRGFQSTGTCDGSAPRRRRGGCCFAAPIAARRIADALGLAGGYASGLAQFYYSGGSGKRIHAAHAAESGVAAALLAAEGYSGPNDIIEGQGGFARAYADGFKPGADRGGARPALSSDGRAGEVARGGGAGRRRHRRDAGAARSSTNSPSATSPAWRSAFPKIIQGRLTNPHPVDLQAAQMCLPFSVALASKITLAPGQIATPRHCGFRGGPQGSKPARARGAHDDRARRRGGGREQCAFHGGTVSVTLRDGRTLSQARAGAQRAARLSPFTGEEHEARFMQELSSRVSEKVCGEIVAMSRDLDRLDPRWLGRVLSGA